MKQGVPSCIYTGSQTTLLSAAVAAIEDFGAENIKPDFQTPNGRDSGEARRKKLRCHKNIFLSKQQEVKDVVQRSSVMCEVFAGYGRIARVLRHNSLHAETFEIRDYSWQDSRRPWQQQHQVRTSGCTNSYRIKQHLREFVQG
jgi:hypothetical protein